MMVSAYITVDGRLDVSSGRRTPGVGMDLILDEKKKKVLGRNLITLTILITVLPAKGWYGLLCRWFG